MKLKDKIAIVTGGGTGIGRAITSLFAAEGAAVVVAGRREALLDETVTEIESNGGRGISIATDISNSKQVQNLVRTTIDTFGRIDILVNAAGTLISKSVTELSEDEWDQVLDINLKGTFLCCKYAIPEILAAGGGAIVNISSILGLVGTTEGAAYCASKGGVIMLTKAMAHDYSPRIRVNAVCPAHVQTEMLDMLFSSQGASDMEMMHQQWALRYPMKRLGTPEDVAKAVLFLASDDASWITGSSLMVTGGLFA